MVNDTPAWVLALTDVSLTPNERILLALLARYQGDNQSAWPKRATLAADLSTSERTVERLISNLAAKGKLTVQRPERQGRGIHNTYVVHVEEKGRHGYRPSGAKGRHGAPKKGDTAVGAIRKNKSEKESHSARGKKPMCETDTGFDKFWTAYPKKVAKKDAEKAWVKLSPSPELLETILAAVERQRTTEQWMKQDGRFIPNPATYLNGQRWTDELPEPKRGDPDWLPTEQQLDEINAQCPSTN